MTFYRILGNGLLRLLHKFYHQNDVARPEFFFSGRSSGFCPRSGQAINTCPLSTHYDFGSDASLNDVNANCCMMSLQQGQQLTCHPTGPVEDMEIHM